ncbi:hypothetical protein F750_5334 [Streptomyces sp. PAMC 26508]|nr:hypothetical protein F750_5334 [Streptomyces sp. PAMC 26508]
MVPALPQRRRHRIFTPLGGCRAGALRRPGDRRGCRARRRPSVLGHFRVLLVRRAGTPLRANGIAARPMGPGPRAMRTAPAWRTHPALPSPEMVKHGG